MGDELNVKVIGSWYPTCDSGRHIPPHPDQTCDEADQWITWRDAILADLARRMFEQFTSEVTQRARLAETVFATAAVADPQPELPGPADIQRALDTLAPHLAWEHRYRP